MLDLLISWLILTVVLWVTALVLPGFHLKSFGSAILAAAVYGLLNVLLGKLLFVVLGVATLGIGFLLAFLTMWVVTAIVLKITDALLTGLKIDGFKWAFIAAMVMSLVTTVLEWVFGLSA